MRISQREKVLLGYSKQSHDPNSSPKTPNRSSDMDFSDVFGGPPSRASFQGMQNRHYDDKDDDIWRGDGDEDDETVMGRSSWSNNPVGKPVFGSETVRQRRYPSGDFFDDIFRGDQSLSSSPRMGGRDPLSPAPGSRVLSPFWPLPPGVEPLGSPAQFSLPARLSTSHSFSTSLLRLSGRAVQNHDEFQGGDVFSSYRRSPLSHEASSDVEELKKGVKMDGSGGGTQAPSGVSQFHFSIHKWASKGAPLVVYLRKRNSLRSKEKSKLEKSLSLNGRIEPESDALVGEIQPGDGNAEVENGISVHLVGNVSCFSAKSTFTETEVVKPDSDAKQSYSNLHGVEGKSGKEAANPEARGNQKQEVVESKLATSSDVDNVASHELVGKSKSKESTGFKWKNKRSSINHRKKMGNDTARGRVEENMGNDRTREIVKEEKGNSGATGKVKEFVKIFNQEPPSKLTEDVNGRSHGSRRWRNTDVLRAESKSRLNSAKPEEKMQGFEYSGGKQFGTTNDKETCESLSVENENLEPTMGLNSDGFIASDTKSDVAFLIEELRDIVDKSLGSVENHEDIQAYESKILKWSKGKEGNIRALLSTLQYVLWPNSGWKPVPLVDIIEANAVKRSYQRALLCLHPDKLQQKRAAFHQKFIAEKVFDILQEAWDQFSSLGSL